MFLDLVLALPAPSSAAECQEYDMNDRQMVGQATGERPRMSAKCTWPRKATMTGDWTGQSLANPCLPKSPAGSGFARLPLPDYQTNSTAAHPLTDHSVSLLPLLVSYQQIIPPHYYFRVCCCPSNPTHSCQSIINSFYANIFNNNILIIKSMLLCYL